MTTTLLLAALTVGQVQFRSCQTAATYRQAYAPITYAAPAYTYYPVAKVETAFVANEVHYPIYSYGVGGAQRALGRRNEELQTFASLTGKVGDLAAAVGRLEARLGSGVLVPPVQPTPDVPAKPTPVVPDKPTPPPLPKTNPGGADDGSVPPPPTVPPSPPAPNPNAAAFVPPNQAVTAILKTSCLKCHQDPAKQGKGVVLFDSAGLVANLTPWHLLRMDSALYSGAMPKLADPLSADAYSQIRAWLNENKPYTDAYLDACRATAMKAAN